MTAQINKHQLLLITLFILILGAIWVSIPVQAATLRVGAGETYTTVAAAVAAASPGDTILIKAETFTEQNIVINKNLTLTGAGIGETIVQAAASPPGADVGRVFNISSGTVNINNMTIQNARFTGEGGAIYCNCDLTLDKVNINNSTAAGAVGEGGAVMMDDNHTLTITDSYFVENTSGQYGGAIGVDFTDGISINNSAFIDNTASSFGGAMQVIAYDANIDITNSLFEGNQGGSQGGAFRTNGHDIVLNMTNNTFTNNTSTGFGGGVVLYNYEGTTTEYNLTNNTFYENIAASNGREVHVVSDSDFGTSDGTLNLLNNIIYNSTQTNFAENGFGGSLVVNRDYTLLGDASLVDTGTGNQNSVDPDLGALADNGGPTQTLAIDNTSPAYNAGTSTDAPITDQRGYNRDDSPDIGAYEVETTTPIYRFYNTNTASHFYTVNASERDNVINNFPQFDYEGSKYAVHRGNEGLTTPVYRFYNRNTGSHFYTISTSERNKIINEYPQFDNEGVAFHVYRNDAGNRRPVYRFYNTTTATHFYTDRLSERNKVINNYPQFNYEGIAYYILD